MNLNILFKDYIIYNIIAGIIFSILYMLVDGFAKYYNLIYGILIIGIAAWSLGRYTLNKIEDDKIRSGVQAAWLLVSLALGYVSIIYAPILSSSIQITVVETILSLVQIVWGAILLGMSYKNGYSIIKV